MHVAGRHGLATAGLLRRDHAAAHHHHLLLLLLLHHEVLTHLGGELLKMT